MGIIPPQVSCRGWTVFSQWHRGRTLSHKLWKSLETSATYTNVFSRIFRYPCIVAFAQNYSGFWWFHLDHYFSSRTECVFCSSRSSGRASSMCRYGTLKSQQLLFCTHRFCTGINHHLVRTLGHKLGLEFLNEVEEEVVLQAQRFLTHDGLHGHHILALNSIPHKREVSKKKSTSLRKKKNTYYKNSKSVDEKKGTNQTWEKESCNDRGNQTWQKSYNDQGASWNEL